MNIKSKGFNTSFTFRETNSNEIIKLNKTLNINSACQNTDIHTKFIKLIKFKKADIVPVH